jgi:hypothetical protein
MPFVLAKKEQFKYAVRVKQPDDKGGLGIFEFTGVFKWLSQTEIQELLARGVPRDRSLLNKVWIGWEGVKTKVKRESVEVEEDLPVTETNREALLAEQGVEAALINAWLDAVVFGPAKN